MKTRYNSFSSLKFNRRFFLLTAGSFAFSTLFSSCQTQNQSQKPNLDTQNNNSNPIRIGWLKGSPLHILKSQKKLEKRFESLENSIGWIEFPTIPVLLEAMNAKTLDYAQGVDASLVFGQSSNVPFVYISATPERPNSLAYVVHEDSPIKSVADLKGKKVGYGRGWNLHYLLVKALQSKGLSIKDINSVPITTAAEGLAAFESRSVDALAIWDPFYARLQRSSKLRVLTDGEGLTSNRGFTIASPEFAQNSPDLIKVILEELQATSDWANKNPSQVAQFLSSQLGIEVESLEVMLRRQTFGVLPVDEKIIAEQQGVADTFFSLGLISKQIQVKNLVAKNPQWLPKELANSNS
ncbi:aliphatic sulfonate ABC transporter substrate-binding protein [Scytonema sp. UIC 10036]|uniref:aliphatic sulfonate ABC transporter substrate-binding protein n=1 Tax=Scytonema sp. UIC 10036 TaxID=2304196 RepID=UPI00140FB4E7|nr:aliphatic sulfonate ABC transporter substrate-binding protein [Scytonema sp. UIC 10036]